VGQTRSVGGEVEMLATKAGTVTPDSLISPDTSPSAGSALLSKLFERFTASSEKLEAQYLALTQEVDELKAQLKSKEEEIKRSERLAMLGETAAALAHEVRNPLGAITLFLSMLRTDISDKPQALGLVDEIERSVTSLNNVVSNVLHFAKNNRLKTAPINIHSILLELSQHFENLYGSGVNFSLDLAGSPFVIGDDQALRQAVYNLVINSLQITSFNATICISTQDSADGDSCIIKVSDNGPGIPEEILERLFEPFVSGRREGTGLGLSIVRRIIEAHGGEVSACNVSGAQFSIRLPRRPVEGSALQQEKV